MRQFFCGNPELNLASSNRFIAERIQMLHIGFYPFKRQKPVVHGL